MQIWEFTKSKFSKKIERNKKSEIQKRDFAFFI